MTSKCYISIKPGAIPRSSDRFNTAPRRQAGGAFFQHKQTRQECAMDAVAAAVLADAAFDAVGEATRFSTQRYREIIEQIRQSGELPRLARAQAKKSPAGTTDQRGEFVS
jgi:hypothetical protein